MTDSALTTVKDFQTAITYVRSTVAPSSARVYTDTFTKWQVWCSTNGIDPFDLNFPNVTIFLNEQQSAKSTKQRQLSALRSLLRVLSAVDYLNTAHWQALHNGLRLIKPSRLDSSASQRQRRALSATEVLRSLLVWEGDDLLSQRNRALVSLLFYTGLRRAEAAALRWQEIDFEHGTIHVAAGKGDKEREVTIVSDNAIDDLRRWQTAQTAANNDNAREYVFCALRRGGHLDADKPIHPDVVRQVTERTSAKSGVLFKPHDARRTLATDLLANNSPIADVQAQLGHSNEATTLRYAQPVSARQRRGRLKTSY